MSIFAELVPTIILFALLAQDVVETISDNHRDVALARIDADRGVEVDDDDADT